MSGVVPYIGSKISLISKSEIRYEGILYTIDPKESTVALQNVRSFGTEGRKKDGEQIPPVNEIYDYIIFRGSDIKDLTVCEPPTTTPPSARPTPTDPAIIATQMPPGQGPQQPMYAFGQYPVGPGGYAQFANPQYNPYYMGFYGGSGTPFAQPNMVPQQQTPIQGQGQARTQQGQATQPVPSSHPSQQTVAPVTPTAQQPSAVQPQAPQAPQPQRAQQKSAQPKGEEAAPTKPPSQPQPQQPKQPEPTSEPQQVTSENGAPQERDQSNAAFKNTNQRGRSSYGRGRGSTRGRGGRPVAPGEKPKFLEDFNFEESLSKFDKVKLYEEMQSEKPEETVKESIVPYSKSSFFDNISCESTQQREKDRKAIRVALEEQRQLDTETFGASSVHRRGGYRGGYRGNRNYHSYNANSGQRQQQSSQRVFRPVNQNGERSAPRKQNAPGTKSG